MNKLPVFHSNKKYWLKLNRLAFCKDVLCPVCSISLQENYNNKYLWCKACRKKYSPTSYKGSWLYGMKLTPRQLFILLWCFQNKKSPDTARLLARVSYTSVQRWYLRFREHLPSSEGLLLEDITQVDESFFGRLRSLQEQTIVVGGIDLKDQIRLQTIDTRDCDTLSQFALDTISLGSLVVTDEWGGYNELEVHGFTRESWNHSLGRFSGTNQIERVWSEIKRYLRKLYGCIPTKHLNLILKEWEARHNYPELFENQENYLKATLFCFS